MSRPSSQRPGAPRLNRRAFLGAAAASGALVVGCDLFDDDPRPIQVPSRGDHALNAWVIVGADDTVTFLMERAEMGQGVFTALAMVLAEELGADWREVRAEPAIADPVRYGPQATAASTSVREEAPFLRKVGAAAREMLLSAAAESWGKDKAGLKAEDGFVVEPATGRRSRFGALAERAARLDAPKDPPLRPPAERTLTGTSPERLDIPAKVTGQAGYGLDVRRPGMLFAALVRPPFGRKISSFDDKEARAVAGVRDVVPIDRGVAVLADNTWAALQGRDALSVALTPAVGGPLSTGAPDADPARSVRARLKAALDEEGVVARKDGRGAAALAGAERVLEAELEAPFLAHVPLEPLNATASVEGGRCTVWAPTQVATESLKAAARAADLDVGDVTVHTTYLGGGFGRRTQTDFVVEAVQLSARVGRPVQVVFDLGDGIRSGHYRPAARARLRAALDDKGALQAFAFDAATTPLGLDEKGIDWSALDGASNFPYAAEHLEVTYRPADTPIPSGFWRSVGNSQNGFFLETFLDRLAHLAKRDPLALRLAWLKDAPRHRGVLEAAAEAAGWGGPLPEGRARGCAVHECFGSFAAQVAEISLEEGRPRVHRIVCALDCGEVIHPENTRAQIESGILFGLSALHQGITVDDGEVQQRSFADYPIARQEDAPSVEVVLVASEEPYGGAGELGVPPAAPAVVNAMFALTRVPVDALPLGAKNGG